MKIKNKINHLIIACGIIAAVFLIYYLSTLISTDSVNLYNTLLLIIPLVMIITSTAFCVYVSTNSYQHKQAGVKSFNEIKYETTFSKSSELIVITRFSDGIILDINEIALNELKLVKSEVVGKTTLDLGIWVYPEKREWLYYALRNTGEVRDYQVELQRDDVQKIYSLSSVIVELDGEKCMITFVKDITDLKESENELMKAKIELEQKVIERTQELARINEELRLEVVEHAKMEIALRKSEEKYRSLVQQLPVGVYRTNIEGKIIHVNKALANILGFDSEEELMNHSVSEFYMDESLRQKLIEDIKQSSSEITNNYLKLKKRDGKVIWILDKAHAVHDFDGELKYFDGIIEDITIEVMQRERISVLYEISNAINSTESLDELFTSIHKTLGKIIEPENFFIAIYDEEKSIISFPYLVDEMDDSIDPIDINSRNSLTAKVIRDGIPYLYRNKDIVEYISNDEEIYGTIPLVWLGVPLKVHNKVIGAIAVQSYRNEDMYSEDDVSLLRSVSDQIALAIDRKRTLISLNFQYYFLQNLIDTIPMPVFYKDIKNRKYIGCNKSFELLVGMCRDELIGKSTFDVFDDELAEVYDSQDNKIISDGGIQVYEGLVRDKTGEIKNALIYKSGFNDVNGNLAGIVGVLIDITERKKYEEKLYLQSVRDSALAELSKGIITLENLEQIAYIFLTHTLRLTHSSIGFIAHYNEDTEEFETFSFLNKQALHKKRAFIKIKKSDFDGKWANLMTHSETLVANNVLEIPLKISKNVAGEYFQLFNEITRMLITPIISGNKIVGILTVANSKENYIEWDIEIMERMASLYSIAGQRVRAEEKIRTALAKEQELSELKSRFILMVSHEYRTPLSAIILSTELLEEYADKFTRDERIKHYSRIKQSINSMTKLLDDIILFNKLDIGIIKFQPDFINIKSFALSLIYELQMMHKDRCKIDFNFTGENIEVWVDEKLIRQILTNLLTNAIKYSHDGDHIEFDVDLKDGEIIFTIQDFGIGIPENDKNHIFQPFHRGTNIGTIAGTGLGLSIVKNALELHSGTIDFESKVGQGTKFVISIPTRKTRMTADIYKDI